MQVIAVANRKGGVGKSTISVHLAAGLAIQGRRVCIVDTDSQGNAARLLGMPETNGVYRLLVDDAALEAVMVEAPADSWRAKEPDEPPSRREEGERHGALWVIGSNPDTVLIPMRVAGALALRRRLHEMERLGIEVVVIDTSPTFSMFDGTVYFAADGLIYVTEAESLSFDGLRRGLQQLQALFDERAQVKLPEMRLLGILPNKVRPGTRVHRRNLAQLGQKFGSAVWTPLALRTLWPEAASYGQTIFSYAPESGEARDAWQMVETAARALEEWES